MTERTKDYDVFLSHSSADKPEVKVIAKLLRDRGLRPWLDAWELVPGQSWIPKLEEAIEKCETIAVFFGPNGKGPWHEAEQQLVLNKSTRSEDDLRIIPVLLPQATQKQISGFMELRTWVEFRNGLDEQGALDRLVAGIKGQAPEAGYVVLDDNPRPYRGLNRFDLEDHEYFFGRNPEIERLIKQLRRDRFVGVVGASGSGKSSLVLAGLRTDHAEAHEPGIKDWMRIVVRPGHDPLHALAAQLYADLGIVERDQMQDRLKQRLVTSPNALIEALQTRYPQPERPILLLVDQLEELFTSRPGQDRGREPQEIWRTNVAAFAANLSGALEAKCDWLRMIVTLRGDFLDQCINVPNLRSLIETRQFWLGEMEREDLREVIKLPAQQRGAYFETGLVRMILRDFQDQRGALPLLSDALDSLWTRRRGPWLTLDAYDDIEGVGGALAQKADDAFAGLTEQVDQRIAKRVFLSLIQLGEGSRDTRKRVSLGDLQSTTDDENRLNAILQRFSAPTARLIAIDTDKAGNKTVEVSHEALIDHWDQLSTWLDQNREHIRFRDRVKDAAEHWEAHGRPNGSLWRVPNLTLLEEFHARLERQEIPLTLNDVEQSFLKQSQELEQAEIQKRIRQRKRLVILSSAASVFALAACVVAVVLWITLGDLGAAKVSIENKNTELAEELAISRSRQLAARSRVLLTTQPDLSLLLAAQACEIKPTLESRSELLSSLLHYRDLKFVVGHEGHVSSLAFSLDGTLLATSGAKGGDIHLWDTDSGQLYRRLPTAMLTPATQLFFGDNELVANFAGPTPVAQIWNIQTGKMIGSKQGFGEGTATAMSSEGLVAIGGGWNGDYMVELLDHRRATIDFFNAIEEDAPRPLPTEVSQGQVVALAFSNDNRMLISGIGLRNRSVLPVVTPRILLSDFSGQPLTLSVKHDTELDSDVTAIAISKDNNRLLYGLRNGSLFFWDIDASTLELQTPQPPKSMLYSNPQDPSPHRSAVLSAGFRDDGWAVSIGTDGDIKVLNAFGGSRQTDHDLVGKKAAISPNGDLAVVALVANPAQFAEGKVLVFSTDSASNVAELKQIAWRKPEILAVQQRTPLVLSPDARCAATVDPDDERKVFVKQFDNRTLTWDSPALPGEPTALEFTPDGQSIACGLKEGDIWLWGPNQTEPRRSLKLIDGAVSCLEFSHDGKRLAVGSSKGPMYISEASIEGPMTALPQRHSATVAALAFSPDGDTLVSADASHGELIVWNRSEQGIWNDVMLEAHKDVVQTIAFGPDGTQFATGGGDNDRSIIVWSRNESKLSPTVLTGHTAAVTCLAFSPDGTTLVSASYSEPTPDLMYGGIEIILWDLETQSIIGRPIIGRDLIATENSWRSKLSDIVFKPDGQLAVLNRAGESWHINLKLSALQKLARELANRPLTSSEKANYLGGD